MLSSVATSAATRLSASSGGVSSSSSRVAACDVTTSGDVTGAPAAAAEGVERRVRRCWWWYARRATRGLSSPHCWRQALARQTTGGGGDRRDADLQVGLKPRRLRTPALPNRAGVDDLDPAGRSSAARLLPLRLPPPPTTSSLQSVVAVVIGRVTPTASVERRRGFTFSSAFTCLFVNRITGKSLDRFSQNSVERWHIGHGRNPKILVVIRIALR